MITSTVNPFIIRLMPAMMKPPKMAAPIPIYPYFP